MNNKLIVFDFDDCLLTTSAKIYIKSTGEALTSQQLADEYQGSENDLDFSEFRSDKLVEPIIPNKKMIRLLKRNIYYYGKDNVVIVTARRNPNPIKYFFQLFNVCPIRIYFIRNDSKPSNIQKRIIVKSIVEKGGYNEVDIYDDDQDNLDAISQLQSSSLKINIHKV